MSASRSLATDDEARAAMRRWVDTRQFAELLDSSHLLQPLEAALRIVRRASSR